MLRALATLLLATTTAVRLAAQTPSACYGTASFTEGQSPCLAAGGLQAPLGMPLQMGLWYGPAPASLPPRVLSGAGSSLAMISSAEGRQYLTPTPHSERPTLEGLIDFVTGAPLYQEIDFELPFGSAVFRHVRTHADGVTPRFIPHTFHGVVPTNESAWDWQGQFWMMSENPILLIDAAYPEIAPEKRTCYLILDAHHSIPFSREGGADPLFTGQRYAAPRWFDARLQPSAPNSNNPYSLPDTWSVWLQRGSLKYTFRGVYEDMWNVAHTHDDSVCTHPACIPGSCDTVARTCSISAHETPSQEHGFPGGYGVPYYALLEQIEDRFGNRAVMSYVQFDPDACVANGDWECQNCNEKGQLRSVKLYRSGESAAAWTIIYTHRSFSMIWANVNGAPEHEPAGWPELPSEYHRWYPHALISIHAYEGDIADTFDQATIPSETFYGQPGATGFDPAIAPIQSFDDYESIDVVAVRGLPTNWKTECLYIHQEPDSRWYQLSQIGSQYARAYGFGVGVRDQLQLQPPNLLKSRVCKREDESQNITRTIYRYPTGYQNDNYGFASATNGTGLRAVLNEATIKQLQDELLVVDGINQVPLNSDNDLFTLDLLNAVYLTSQPEDLTQYGNLLPLFMRDEAPDSDYAHETPESFAEELVVDAALPADNVHFDLRRRQMLCLRSS